MLAPASPSPSAIRAVSRARIESAALPRRVLEAAIGALEAAQPDPAALLEAAIVDAELPRALALERAVGIDLCYVVGHLADDLMDGDAGYLERCQQTGPCLQFILHNLAFAVLAQAGVPATTLAQAHLELARAAGLQPLEVLESRQSLDLYRRIGEAILGRQWVAYLRLLWAGTTLEEEAEPLGLAIGVAGHVAMDRHSAAARLVSLSGPDQAAIEAWGRQACQALAASPRRCAARALAEIRALDPALGRTTGADQQEGA